jgi:hypothetical protein
MHAQCAEFGGEHFGKTTDGPLRRLVGRHARGADAATDGGDVDDVTAATLTHMAYSGAGEIHHAEEIGFDLRAIVGGRHLLERDELAVTRVVDEHIELAERVEREGHGGDAGGFVGYIECGDPERVGKPGLEIVEYLDASRRGNDTVTGRERRFGDIATETRAATGNEPDLCHGDTS